MKYRKAQKVDAIGSLYLVVVRLDHHDGEIIRHRLLVVGVEERDIERKIKWLFDPRKYAVIKIISVEKIEEGVHVLSTSITEEKENPDAVIKRPERTENVIQGRRDSGRRVKRFAVGIATHIYGRDADHALRKIGRALKNTGSPIKSTSAPKLSAGSTVRVEEVGKGSGVAMPRDVSTELNRAVIFRG